MRKTTSNLEELEDTKGVIRIRKSKDRQHNGQKKKDWNFWKFWNFMEFWPFFLTAVKPPWGSREVNSLWGITKKVLFRPISEQKKSLSFNKIHDNDLQQVNGFL